MMSFVYLNPFRKKKGRIEKVLESLLPKVFFMLFAFFIVWGVYDAHNLTPFPGLPDRLFVALFVLCVATLMMKRK